MSNGKISQITDLNSHSGMGATGAALRQRCSGGSGGDDGDFVMIVALISVLVMVALVLCSWLWSWSGIGLADNAVW